MELSEKQILLLKEACIDNLIYESNWSSEDAIRLSNIILGKEVVDSILKEQLLRET